MKQFDKKVKWNFKFSFEGYGRNVIEALRNGAEQTIVYCEDLEHLPEVAEKIEKFEVIYIDEEDEE